MWGSVRWEAVPRFIFGRGGVETGRREGIGTHVWANLKAVLRWAVLGGGFCVVSLRTHGATHKQIMVSK